MKYGVAHSLFALVLLFPVGSPATESWLTNGSLEVASAEQGLERAIESIAGSAGPEPFWIAWEVPIVDPRGPASCVGAELMVLVRVDSRSIEDVRAFSASCPLDAGGRRVVLIDSVAPPESVRLLAGLVRRRLGDGECADLQEQALAALALHRGTGATALLSEIAAGSDAPACLREDAIFWLGEARGEPGYRSLVSLIAARPGEELLEEIAFALSESPVPAAEGTLVELATAHELTEVREEALFWLAQRGGPRALETLKRALIADPDREVREHAVFALSELSDGRGVDELLRVARDESYPEDVRKQAFFWLAQSDDPRAIALLEEFLIGSR